MAIPARLPKRGPIMAASESGERLRGPGARAGLFPQEGGGRRFFRCWWATRHRFVPTWVGVAVFNRPRFPRSRNIPPAFDPAVVGPFGGSWALCGGVLGYGELGRDVSAARAGEDNFLEGRGPFIQPLGSWQGWYFGHRRA